MKNQKGFSLIELMVVVSIIGIIAAIAVPNLISSRRAANEASAISSLRVYHGGQATFASTVGGGNYAGAVSGTNPFPELGTAQILDGSLASGLKSGYTFDGAALVATSTSSPCHVGQALPTTPSGATQTGSRHFIIATDGLIYGDNYGGGIGYTASGGLCTITGGAPVGN